MSKGATSQLTIGLILLVVVVLVILRRMRPQPVNPTRVAIMGAVFVAVLLFTLVSDFTGFVAYLPAVIAAPFALVAGGALGLVIVRSMRFWTDPQTGLLWMRGGLVFAVIYVITLLLRLGVTYVADAGSQDAALAHLAWLHGVTGDLVFLSIGMWVVRAVLIYNRYRQHLVQGGVAAGTARPAR